MKTIFVQSNVAVSRTTSIYNYTVINANNEHNNWYNFIQLFIWFIIPYLIHRDNNFNIYIFLNRFH